MKIQISLTTYGSVGSSSRHKCKPHNACSSGTIDDEMSSKMKYNSDKKQLGYLQSGSFSFDITVNVRRKPKSDEDDQLYCSNLVQGRKHPVRINVISGGISIELVNSHIWLYFGVLIGGFGVLSWNEGRAVHTTLSLDEALDDAITVDPNDELDHNYNGRIVHLSGPIVIGEPLREPDYNIQVLAVKLQRRMKMFQWVEESVEHNYGESIACVQTESRSYYYYTEWRDKLIDSRSFYIPTGHQNPNRFPVESQTQVADAVFIGKYELGNEIKNKFSNNVDLTSDSRPDDPTIKMNLGLYYHTNDVFNPEIGDIRLLFSSAGMEGEMYSVVGKVVNSKILPYRTSRGVDILLAYSGELGLADVFKHEHHAQRLTTWGYRSYYFLAVLAPDPHFSVGANLMLSLSFALIVASIAWILHRPIIGASLLFAAASPFVWCARSVTNYQRVN